MTLTPAHVRAARGLLQITQLELGKIAGVSPTTVRKFENGQLKPSEDTLLRLQTFLEARGVRFLNSGSPGVRLVDSRTPGT